MVDICHRCGATGNYFGEDVKFLERHLANFHKDEPNYRIESQVLDSLSTHKKQNKSFFHWWH